MKTIKYTSVFALIIFLFWACEKDSEIDNNDSNNTEEPTDTSQNEVVSKFDTISLNPDTLEVVQYVDLTRYLGLWYEIGTIPQSFQSGCACTTAEYVATQTDTVTVINSCNLSSPQGQNFSLNGTAVLVDEVTNAKLKVQFFNTTPSDYWIIDLAKDYSWAVVGSPTKDFFWLLCRERTLDQETQDYLYSKWEANGYVLDNYRLTTQQGCD